MMPVGFSGSSNPQLVHLSNTSGKHRHKHDDKTVASAPPGFQHTHVEGSELIVSGRKILMNNRIKCVYVQANETLEDICNDLDIMPWQIYRYNDIHAGSTIKAGELLYLQPKRKKSKIAEHVVKPGESMWEISQIYGIRLTHLYKMNTMNEGVQLADGQRIKLR
jgi:LysM repeat protein